MIQPESIIVGSIAIVATYILMTYREIKRLERELELKRLHEECIESNPAPDLNGAAKYAPMDCSH